MLMGGKREDKDWKKGGRDRGGRERGRERREGGRRERGEGEGLGSLPEWPGSS